MDRETLDRYCEKGILALVLGILVFGPLAFGAVDRRVFLVIQAACAGILILWLVRIWAAKRFEFLWPPICWAVLAFVAYAVGRYRVSDIEYIAREELLRVLTYAFLFLAVINNLHRKDSVQVIVFTMVFVAMGIAFYALFQFATNSQRVWHVFSGYVHRGSGTYISPNHLAGFLEMILPVALAYVIAGRTGHVARILLGYASLVILAGIAVTLSRGGWISAAISCIALFCILLTQRPYRIPAAIALVLIAGSCLYLVPKSRMIVKRAHVVSSSGAVDDDKRFALWRPAIKLWQENRWWGIGPGHFDARFRTVRPEDVQLQPDRVHNDFLNALTDWGIVGSALIAIGSGLAGIAVVCAWPHVRREHGDLGKSRNSNKFAFLVGASCGLLAIFVHSGVDFNMHIPANAILATTWLALISSHVRFSTERWWHQSVTWTRVAATALLIVGVGYLSQQTFRLGMESVWLRKADKAPSNSPLQARSLERAFFIEPKNFETAYRIGEAFRRQSQFGEEQYPELQGENYMRLAERAMDWFHKSIALNQWHAYSYLGIGWCLDWLDRKPEAATYFDHAEALDPNGYFTVANVGIHFVESGDLPAAREWFRRSLRLQRENNYIAGNYLALVNLRMLQAATNQPVRTVGE